MTEYLRKDMNKGMLKDPSRTESKIDQSRMNLEESKFADPNSTEDVTARGFGRHTESRTLVTPPPAESRPMEPRSASVTSSPAAGAAVARAPEEEKAALFALHEANELRARWDNIQVGFVDEPRKAVQEADALVSATIKRLSEVFADERKKLEQQWGQSENASTEDFRVALRRYRSFFARLLAI